MRRINGWAKAWALAWVGTIGSLGCSPGPPVMAPDFGDSIDGGWTDAGARDTSVSVDEAALPTLTPCPDGWLERRDDDGIAFCDPWPGGSPVVWTCPTGWVPDVTDGAKTCLPPTAAPVEWPCPTGWRATSDDGTQGCEPYPPGGPESCGPFEAHFPGTAGCARVGTPCPADGLPEGLPAQATVVYVRAGAQGGDGTRSRPYGSLDEGLAAARTPGTIVALGRGTYSGEWSLTSEVTLWGACPDETTLSSVSRPADGEGIIDVRGVGRATIRNLSFRDALRPGVTVSGPTATATIASVVMDAVERVGLRVYDRGHASLETVTIRNVQPIPDGSRGRGISVDTGGSLTGRDVILERNHEVGMLVRDPGARAAMEGLVIRTTRTLASEEGGWGLLVFMGGHAELRRVLLDRNREVGAIVLEAGSALALEDAMVRDTVGPSSTGITVGGGASVNVRRAMVERNARQVAVDGEGSSFSGEVLILRAGDALPSRSAASGLLATNRASARLARSLVTRNVGFGVFADRGSQLVLEDTIVRETLSYSDAQESGIGLVLSAASAELRRVLLERNRTTGLWVVGPGAALIAEDLVLRETLAPDGPGGYGMSVEDGASAEVRRALFAGNREIAIDVASGASLVLEHGVVRDTIPRTEGRGAQGMSVVWGAHARVSSSHFERNSDASMFVSESGSSLVLSDSLVRETHAAGRGVNIQAQARAELRRTSIEGSRGLGLFVADSEFVAEDLVVRDIRGLDDGSGGRGIFIGGSTTSIRRATIERCRTNGVSLSRGTAELEDVLIRDVSSQQSDGMSGAGLQVGGGAAVRARRLAVLRSRGVGVLVGETGSRMQAEDLTIQDVSTQQRDQAFGRGLEVQGGGTATISRARIQRNRDIGVFVRRASAILDHVDILDTSRPDCASQPTSCRHSATGAAVFEGTLRFAHGVIARSQDCGLSIGGPSSVVNVAQTLIADNGVGACIHFDGFDTRRISADGVVFADNGSRIERTSIPAPELLPAVADPSPGEERAR